MFFSFLVKFKVIHLNKDNQKIERFKEKYIFNNLKDIVISNILTKDKEFSLNKSYFIRVSSLTPESKQKITRYLIKAQVFGEEIEFQNQKIIFEEIILNDKKNIDLQRFLTLEIKDTISIKFLSPTIFRFGDEYYSEPNPYLYLLKISKKFLQTFPDENIKKEVLNIPKYIFKNIKIKYQDVKIKKLNIKNQQYKGFLGEVEFDLSSIDNSLKIYINYLFYFSYFTGVGEFTEYGMGQINL